MNTNIERIDFLDFLRGIAMLLVFCAHITFLINIPILDSLQNLFARGVQLFYLVSGFTIFMIYIDKIHTKKDFREYLIKRFFRIMPLLYILLPIYYFVLGLQLEGKSSLPDWYHLLSHYILIFGFHQDTMVSIMGQAWSIFDEFIFYIIFAILLLMKFKLKVNIHKYIILLFVISVWTFILYNLFLSNGMLLKKYLALSPFVQMYIFFLGGGVFLFVKKIIISKKIFFLSILILISYSFVLKSSTLSMYLSSILFSIIILYFAQNKGNYNQLFLFFGKISFSFYLIHSIVIAIFVKYILFLLPLPIGIFIIFMTTTFLSFLSYIYIEKPFILLGKKIIKYFSA